MSENKYIVRITDDQTVNYIAPGKIYGIAGQKYIPLTENIRHARLYDTYNGAAQRARVEVCNMQGDIEILTVDNLTLNILNSSSVEATEQDIIKEKRYKAMLLQIGEVLNDFSFEQVDETTAIKRIRHIVRS